MAADESLLMLVAARAKAPPTVSGETFYWDGSGAVYCCVGPHTSSELVHLDIQCAIPLPDVSFQW
jgi:AraC-like DNA-binding protein